MYGTDWDTVKRIKNLKARISGRQVRGTYTETGTGYVSSGLGDHERALEDFIYRNLLKRRRLTNILNVVFLVTLGILLLSIVLVMAADVSLKAGIFSSALLIILLCYIPHMRKKMHKYTAAIGETEKKLKADDPRAEFSAESEKIRRSICRGPEKMNILAAGAAIIQIVLCVALAASLWMSYLDDYRVIFSIAAIIIGAFAVPFAGVLILTVSGIKPSYEYRELKREEKR